MDEHFDHRPADDGQEDVREAEAGPVRMPSARITTIVGGRPSAGAAAPAAGFSPGIEQTLTLAALDGEFRQALARDPISAAANRGLGLTPSEAQLLSAIPGSVLEHAIDHVLVPRSSRRGFIKSVSASVLAMLGGAASLATLGSEPGAAQTRGISPYMPGAQPVDGPSDYWIFLVASACFLHVPARNFYARRVPWLFVFHDDKKTVLDEIKAWRTCSDEKGFILVSADWSGRRDHVEWAAADAALLPDALMRHYHITPEGPIVVAGTGTGAAVALRAGLFGPLGGEHFKDAKVPFSAAIAADGSLPDGWETRKLFAPEKSAVYAAAGAGSAEAKRLAEQVGQLEKREVRTRMVEVREGTAAERMDRAAAWEWATTPKK